MTQATGALATIVLLLFLGGDMAAHAAITAQMAKECRALMIKTHPTEVFSGKGSAAAQRTYFAKCIQEHSGNSEDQKAPTQNTLSGH